MSTITQTTCDAYKHSSVIHKRVQTDQHLHAMHIKIYSFIHIIIQNKFIDGDFCAIHLYYICAKCVLQVFDTCITAVRTTSVIIHHKHHTCNKHVLHI